MKKFIVTLILVISLVVPTFAASSDDIYVRKDVFNVHMLNINQNLERILSELQSQRNEINSMRNDINELAKATAVLSARIDGIDNRVSDLRNDIYLGIVILGIILALPNIQKFFQWREAHKSTLSIQDIEKLIDARLNAKSQ